MKKIFLLLLSLGSLSLFASGVKTSFREFAMNIEGNYSPIKNLDECPEIKISYSINDWDHTTYYGKEQIEITPSQGNYMGEGIETNYFFSNDYQPNKNRVYNNKVTDLRVLTKGVNSFKSNKDGTYRLKQYIRFLYHIMRVNCLYRKIN
jgi:hypothetical protein